MEPTLFGPPAPVPAATLYMDLRDVETTSPSPSGALLARCNALSPPYSCALRHRATTREWLTCVTRANLAAALVVFEWPGPGALRKADCEPLLDYYYGASWSGVLRWVRLLRRVPA